MRRGAGCARLSEGRVCEEAYREGARRAGGEGRLCGRILGWAEDEAQDVASGPPTRIHPRRSIFQVNVVELGVVEFCVKGPKVASQAVIHGPEDPSSLALAVGMPEARASLQSSRADELSAGGSESDHNEEVLCSVAHDSSG